MTRRGLSGGSLGPPHTRAARRFRSHRKCRSQHSPLHQQRCCDSRAKLQLCRREGKREEGRRKKEGKGREGKGREGKGREGKGRGKGEGGRGKKEEGRRKKEEGREGKGREGKGSESFSSLTPRFELACRGLESSVARRSMLAPLMNIRLQLLHGGGKAASQAAGSGPLTSQNGRRKWTELQNAGSRRSRSFAAHPSETVLWIWLLSTTARQKRSRTVSSTWLEPPGPSASASAKTTAASSASGSALSTKWATEREFLLARSMLGPQCSLNRGGAMSVDPPRYRAARGTAQRVHRPRIVPRRGTPPDPPVHLMIALSGYPGTPPRIVTVTVPVRHPSTRYLLVC
eukprot:SAG31_NODE_4188_length_3491_cov_1.981427_2_plen_344_part_00